jgi:hypothetical protein
MKALLTALSLTVSVAALADHHENWDKKLETMNFPEAKSMMQEKVRMKSAMMEEYSSCINNAKDKTALMSCKEDKMQDKKAMKEQLKTRKQSMEEKLEKKIEE